MRDIWLVAAVLIGMGITLRRPFVGVIIWTWFALMAPHQEAFGFSRTLPLNLVVALTTIASWLLSNEPKKIARSPIIVFVILFLAWTTFNSFFAYNTAWSWPFWDRTWRIFALGIVASVLTTNKVRYDALVMTIVISLFYYGVKGGIFTLETGGAYHVMGPEDTIIGDNNQLALALLMTLPMAEYLRTRFASKLASVGILICMALTGVAILGSYSRGAIVAMAAMALFRLMQTKRRFLYLVSVLTVMVPALYFMPPAFYDRLNTMNSVSAVSADGSFHGRWIAWQVAIYYALDHFPFGAGFYGPQLNGVFLQYFPLEEAHAAHSIYFQVLGEHGVIGLALYVSIFVLAFVSCIAIIRRSKSSVEHAWANKLAQMIMMSLIAFSVGGALLSMAYYDMFVLLICVLPPLRKLVDSGPEAQKVQKWRATAGSEIDVQLASQTASRGA